jgi:aspartate racemase
MVVYYCRHAPVLITDAGPPVMPLRPDPRLFDAAKRLGILSDFLVITSNGAHAFRAEIERAAGREVVSMIDATLGEVRRRGWRSVGVLGLGDPVIYTEPLRRLGISFETLDSGRRDALDAAVFRLMEGRDDADSAGDARAAVASLRARGVDGVILGCTEIPLLLGQSADEADLINPAQLLAEAAVQAALT